MEILTFGQRSTIKKSKSTGPESKSTVKVLTGQIRVVRVGSVDTADMADDVSLTGTRADVEVLAWLLTWSDDVIR